MKPQVVVVGSYVQDLTWKCAAFPRPGETVIGTFVTGPGGKGSNQAVASGRAAPPPSSSARSAGRLRCGSTSLLHGGGHWRPLIEKPRHATGTAGILVNDAGQNEIVVALGANAVLAKGDIDLRLIAERRPSTLTELQRIQGMATRRLNGSAKPSCPSCARREGDYLRLAKEYAMLTVISPAKRLDETRRALPAGLEPTEPMFAADAARLARIARGLTVAELRDLMGISERWQS